jgi:glucose-6-phosphate dehydrogenase-like protein
LHRARSRGLQPATTLSISLFFRKEAGSIRDDETGVPGVRAVNGYADHRSGEVRLEPGSIEGPGSRHIKEHGRFDADAFAQLAARLQYIDGDYNDQATYERLRQTLANAQRPVHYLAIPPSMFGRVADGHWPNPDAQKLALLSKNPLAATSLRRRR